MTAAMSERPRTCTSCRGRGYCMSDLWDCIYPCPACRPRDYAEAEAIAKQFGFTTSGLLHPTARNKIVQIAERPYVPR